MSATPPPPPPPPQQPYGGQQPQLSPADEKLWATLIHVGGILFSFIPALVGYNYFGARLRAMRAEMEDFILEFLHLTSRWKTSSSSS